MPTQKVYCSLYDESLKLDTNTLGLTAMLSFSKADYFKCKGCLEETTED